VWDWKVLSGIACIFIASLVGNVVALLCINISIGYCVFATVCAWACIIGEQWAGLEWWMLATGDLALYRYLNDPTRNLYQHCLNSEVAWCLIGEGRHWPHFYSLKLPTHLTDWHYLCDLPYVAAELPSKKPAITTTYLLDMAIPTPTRDPLLQHMFAYLIPRRDALPSHIVETIAGE
jgi:hypothetical protein